MAVTVSFYDTFIERMGDGSMDMDTDSFKVILMSSGHSFASSHTAKSQVNSNQIASTNGYTQDSTVGELKSVTWNFASSAQTFDAADLTWTASGGSITASHAVMYDDTMSTSGGDPETDGLVCSINFGQSESAGDATDFKITWDSSGIFKITK